MRIVLVYTIFHLSINKLHNNTYPVKSALSMKPSNCKYRQYWFYHFYDLLYGKNIKKYHSTRGSIRLYLRISFVQQLNAVSRSKMALCGQPLVDCSNTQHNHQHQPKNERSRQSWMWVNEPNPAFAISFCDCRWVVCLTIVYVVVVTWTTSVCVCGVAKSVNVQWDLGETSSLCVSVKLANAVFTDNCVWMYD